MTIFVTKRQKAKLYQGIDDYVTGNDHMSIMFMTSRNGSILHTPTRDIPESRHIHVNTAMNPYNVSLLSAVRTVL